jgi:transcription factor AP-1
METTMYDDNMRSVKKMKTSMTLDLNTPTSKPADKLTDILGSPDLGLLMLASPDLERFIYQQNGLVLTTPTPTSQILYPRTVTEEQEAYARGFVDALGELHKSYGGIPTTLVVPPVTVSSGPAAAVVSCTTVARQPVVLSQPITTTTMLPGSVLANPTSTFAQLLPIGVVSAAGMPMSRPTPTRATVNQSLQPQVFQVKSDSQVFQVKSETIAPQTVPSMKAPTSLPPITPINMDDQEMAKLERKRARNRVAATRCRNRKLERISRLQERVKELQDQNVNLARTASTLRDQVCRLKQNIIEHKQRGCQVMLTHNLL